jgi:hypothetical protein
MPKGHRRKEPGPWQVRVKDLPVVFGGWKPGRAERSETKTVESYGFPQLMTTDILNKTFMVSEIE